MAEKKKMSVAEILAAARKSDQKGGSPSQASEPAAAADEGAASIEPAATEPAAESAPVESAAEPAAKVAKPKPAAAAGGRPNVSDILAAARANKGAAAKAPPAAKAAPKPAAAKPAPKPAAAKAADKTAEKPAKAPAVSGVKDTASILAAARGGVKPGPMSKAEAAARLKPEAPAAVKTKPAVPPMPPKPEFVRSKPAAGKPTAAPAAEAEGRRGFMVFALGSFLAVGFTSLTATLALWTLGTARFMFPNVLIEPPSKFKVGFPSDFAPGVVEEKFKAQFGVWVVKGEYQGQPEIYALRTVCTHLGCTPNWLEAEQKFKCPCHGSGFYKDGINFEGPAPRPLERYAIRLADDGQLEIDKSKMFQEEMGQWKDAASFVPV
ncbi:MAG TPA: ubiquinol-cytochrome c reductase iron-sulfur subunit [Pirellulales bacterium]|nr:ubiquinol-cytochrome c reductase iron-sulfur subunit [Pirellulales bacterium]